MGAPRLQKLELGERKARKTLRYPAQSQIVAIRNQLGTDIPSRPTC